MFVSSCKSPIKPVHRGPQLFRKQDAEGLALLHSTQMLQISVLYCSTYHLKFKLSFWVLVRLHFVVVLLDLIHPVTEWNHPDEESWFNGCYLSTSAWCPQDTRDPISSTSRLHPGWRPTWNRLLHQLRCAGDFRKGINMFMPIMEAQK